MSACRKFHQTGTEKRAYGEYYSGLSATRKLTYGLALLCSWQNARFVYTQYTCANSYDSSGTQPADTAWPPGAAPTFAGAWKPTPASRWTRSALWSSVDSCCARESSCATS